MLIALTEKVHILREQYPGRRILVLRDNYCAVFLDCEMGKDGVEITVSSLDGGSERQQTLQWDPASYAIMVEEASVGDQQSAAPKADERQFEQAPPKKNPPKRGGALKDGPEKQRCILTCPVFHVV
ncbi:hypothetical protein CupriaWKF_30475 [Cupriavidus sp. WKF15]|uniref:hypothetical protein n=1 Tax=Cupriavidus sp. WKF15 TaxID=3032282 RepID=UPI0023E19E8D|nr:hypothetical protein [Cupriavidus sp. WKF15]WER50690.1 hypothetical protein CupriaWKF_30475 [Cupriavidus sp. WKF15]